MKSKTLLLSALAALLLPLSAIQAKPDGGQYHRSGPGGMLKHMDSNNDGEVTRAEAEAEAKARIDQLFERLDTDGDGVITKEEIEACRDDRKEKRRERPSRDDDEGDDTDM